MNTLLKNQLSRFLILVFLFYLIWYLLYHFIIEPAQIIDLFVIDVTIVSGKWILELLGYAVFTGAERIIGIDGTGGLWIGDNCNGLSLFAIFSGFIIAYPGNWKKKLWYIPLGVLLIELLNILRVVGLAILDTYSRKWTEFNHTYTFNILIYGFIFLLWMHWTNKIAADGLLKNKA